MLNPPYTITRCSWPRPVEQNNDHWTSEPEWDAPLMPIPPQPHWTTIHNNICWLIDWCKLFEGELKYWNPRQDKGEMRGFHVVFQIQINEGGTFVFWDDDGGIIRRHGEIIHTDRATHALTRNEIEVSAGDHLEIAQWQNYGGWLWGAEPIVNCLSSVDLFLPYLAKVQQRLRTPNGPALKLYTHGGTPIRTILAVYSMILNGYRPLDVLVFGEYQWSEYSRKLFTQFFPFAHIVSTEDILGRLRAVGGIRLADIARHYWFVMKTCASLLYPPEEFCFMDDDVFILDSVDDALTALRTHNLVFAQDADYGELYLATWGRLQNSRESLRTGRLNAGLYWLRNSHHQGQLAATMLRVPPRYEQAMHWEQGFLAIQYVHELFVQLPTQRYFYPYFDGLPGGIAGYDYASNPCGFASIHFGGLVEKPSDTVALMLAQDILGRCAYTE